MLYIWEDCATRLPVCMGLLGPCRQAETVLKAVYKGMLSTAKGLLLLFEVDDAEVSRATRESRDECGIGVEDSTPSN